MESLRGLNYLGKKAYLNDLLFLILQSKPDYGDIEPAILESGLKPLCTACVLIRKGVENHSLQKLLQLPENERNQVFNLFLNLFKIAYQRRFEIEKMPQENGGTGTFLMKKITGLLNLRFDFRSS